MNILFTSHSFAPDIGGIEVSSEILASYFSSRGHSVILVTQSDCGLGDEDRFQFQFDVVRRPGLRRLISLSMWADVVYQNNIELKTVWPTLLLGKPFVISIQTWIRSMNGSRRSIDYLKLSVLRRAQGVIAISNSIKNDSLASASVIGNPYKSDIFTQLDGHPRSKAVVFSGRLVSDKGVDSLIEVFAALLLNNNVLRSAEQQGLKLILTVIGDGPERTHLEQLAKDYGILDSVDFVGFLDAQALAHSLNEHQILVVPSRWAEPFGIVALEGAACGCVVLGSDAGGLPDAIGPAGRVFRSMDKIDFMNKLKDLLCDSDLRRDIISLAPAHLSNYQPDRVAQRYLDIIERAIANC